MSRAGLHFRQGDGAITIFIHRLRMRSLKRQTLIHRLRQVLQNVGNSLPKKGRTDDMHPVLRDWQRPHEDCIKLQTKTGQDPLQPQSMQLGSTHADILPSFGEKVDQSHERSCSSCGIWSIATLPVRYHATCHNLQNFQPQLLQGPFLQPTASRRLR